MQMNFRKHIAYYSKAYNIVIQMSYVNSITDKCLGSGFHPIIKYGLQDPVEA